MNRDPLRRSSVLSLAAACLASGLPLSATAEADDNLARVRAQMSEKFEAIEPGDVDIGPIDGWYKIQKGPIVAYVSEDGRYLLQGDLIDLESGVNLSDRSRDEARREIMASVGDDDVIRFTPADVKHRVTVFTDVGCTYCRRLHAQIEDYMAHGIEVRYMLYPRNGPTSKEWNTSEKVWCAEDRNGALTAAKLDRAFPTSTCDASIVQEHYEVGKQVGLSGTPAIVLEDGTLIGGYLPANALNQQIEQKLTQASVR